MSTAAASDFPYLVVSASGARVALYARAELALCLCESLADGATIQAHDTVLWRHDKATWDAAHAGEDEGIEMLANAVKSMRQQLARLEKN